MSWASVLFTLGSVVLVCCLSAQADLCASVSDVPASNSSLIFKAQLLARKPKRARANEKGVRCKVLMVHRGKSVINSQSNIELRQSVQELCDPIYPNVTFWIFADSPRNSSNKQTAKGDRNRPMVLIPKWIIIPTCNASHELQKIFGENCDSPMVQIKRKHVKVNEGEKIEFTCEISGNSAHSIYWTKNHVAFNSSAHVQILTKRRGSQLKINEAAVRDAGIYRCHAQSSTGLTSTAVTKVVVAAKSCKNNNTCKNLAYCLNGGTCCTRDGHEYCICDPRYYGKRCDSRVAEEIIDKSQKSQDGWKDEDFSIVIIIIVIAAMLATVLLIIIVVIAMKIRRQGIRQSRDHHRASQQRHCHHGNKFVSTISPVPFITINSDFQISSAEVINEGAVFPVQTDVADVEGDCKWLDRDATYSRTKVNDFEDIVDRRSNGTLSTQSLCGFKWDSSDVGDDDDDVKANRASDADVLDVDDDRCITSTSRDGDTSEMSSQFGGDTTSWTQDGESENDVDLEDGGRLLRQLYAYNIGTVPSLDNFAVGGVLPSLKDYIGVVDSDSMDGRRDIELVPTASSVES